MYGAQAGIRKLGRAEGSVPDVAAVSVRLVREVEDHTGVGEALRHPHPAGREGEPGARRAGEASAKGKEDRQGNVYLLYYCYLLYRCFY